MHDKVIDQIMHLTACIMIIIVVAFGVVGAISSGMTYHKPLPILQAEKQILTKLHTGKFDSLVEAATAAEKVAYDSGYDVEWGGIILKTPEGKYRFALPNSDHKPDGVAINWFYPPKGFVIAGEYHTHPCLPYSHVPEAFSIPDAASALYTQLPTFIANLCLGEVREFDPSIDSPDNVTINWQGHTFKVTSGRSVGHFSLTKLPIILESQVLELQPLVIYGNVGKR